jgi:hypothetical protein
MKNNISGRIIDCIEPEYRTNPPSIAELELRVRQAYCERQK